MVQLLVRDASRLALVALLVVAGLSMTSCASVMEFLQDDGPAFAPPQPSPTGRRVPMPPTIQDVGIGE